MTNTGHDRSVRAGVEDQARRDWLAWPLLAAMVAGLALLFFGERVATQVTGAVIAVAMFVAALSHRRTTRRARRLADGKRS
ncbi:hypothetical protein [Micromonospora endolithica]|uniref:hypothetical protein n=1 Tax=Micromonospora endolithica TaxID=230091 RepID=UPI0011AC104F|nr:hypothetical protein [Micromonospora endolithica]TWJ23617.1 hypothetical protein JD76_03756 [Micromonospora endolithica]